MTGKTVSLPTVLLLLTVSAMPVSGLTGQPGRSILFLLDLSYSMNLQDSSTGLSRIESARNTVSAILDDARGDEEWALIGASDESRIEVLAPLTRSVREIRSSLQKRKPWGTTPLSAGLRTAVSYLKTAARAPVGAVVLLSDCMSTESGFSVDALRALFVEAGIRLYIMGFPMDDNPGVLLPFTELAPATEGAFYFPADAGALSLRLQVMAPRPAPADSPSDPSPAGMGAGDPVRAVTERLAVLWGLVAVGVILMALLLRALLLSKARLDPDPVAVFHFEILTPPRERRLVSLKSQSVRIGTGPDCDLRVGTVSGAVAASGTRNPAESHLTVGLQDGSAVLRAMHGVLVNGVVRQDKRLKEGDLIRLDGARIAYRGLDPGVPETRRRHGDFRLLFLAGIGFAAALLAALVFTVRTGASRLDTGDGIPAAAAVPAAAGDSTPRTGSGSAPSGRAETPDSGAPQSAPASRGGPTVVAPGEAVPAVKADILLLHAHPDDECIDFGCLIAKAARAGKTVVQVTLTDGEAGLDYHEERDTEHVLPAGTLAGRELAAVRAGEEWNALSRLGVRLYVRFGLRNHPYNTSAQVVPKGRLFAAWGGEAEVVGRIVALLETLRPEVVVSPDRRSAAKEHFEHEAAGDLVRTAVAAVQRRGRVSLKGHVVSVDPRQRSAYRDLVTVDGMESEASSGFTFRELQSQALAAHMTQRDASVIAREVLSSFRYEYYQSALWKLPQSLDEWLGE